MYLMVLFYLNNTKLWWFFFFLSFSSPLSLQDEKNQVLTTNIWLQMVSFETKYVCFSTSVLEFNLVRGLNFRKLSGL